MLEPCAITETRDIFISYASEDREFVFKLVQGFLDCGLTVWLDRQDVDLGDSLQRSVDEGIRRAKFAVAVLSETYFTKAWPKAELAALVSLEIEGMKVLFPVLHNITFEQVGNCGYCRCPIQANS